MYVYMLIGLMILVIIIIIKLKLIIITHRIINPAAENNVFFGLFPPHLEERIFCTT